MSELQRQIAVQADKLDREYDLLDRMRSMSYDDEEHCCIMLAQAKRVRKESSILIRLLAQQRDNLQA